MTRSRRSVMPTRALWIALGVVFCSAIWVQAQPAPTPPTPVPPTLPELVTPPLPAGTTSQVPTAKPLTLKEAIALALREQPQVMLATGNLEAAAGSFRTARSGLLPSFSVTGSAAHSGPSGGGPGAVGRISSTRNSVTTDLAGQQLIYDFGRTPAAVAASRAQEDSARQNLAQTRQDVVNQVKQSYYTLLQNQRLVEVQRRNLTDQQAHLDLAKARLDAGTAPHSDVVRAETSVADAVFNLATAQNTAAVSRVALNQAMGVDLRSPTAVEETEEPLPALPEPAVLVEQAMAHRPVVAQARDSLSAAREALRAARTGNTPALVASGSYEFSGSSFPPTNKSWAYGVSLQWDIFDSGSTSGRVETARGNLLSAEASLKQTEQTVASDVIQSYLDLQTAEQKVTAARSEVANAEEGVRLAAGRYQAGVAAYIEVTDAETALVTASTNQVNALYGLSVARAALRRALGMGEGE